ncbi:hypothetical protein PRN20_08375 [Devosia sp. ZB163]|uniref:hypothetical protein n=1 Tax=Devosia sp. ZB163 TaxID=3025938 RepID=UPI00235F27AF|nr:hypothetical protein [Devosia sp. ZB163]MDC9823746.1 hypothetical protein [Devosia sp. ZB163]
MLKASLVVLGLAWAGQVPAHEIGDFGRVKPGVLNDQIIPELDRWGRRAAGQPVSGFNVTDQEREMHDRVYRFLIARHVKDWAFDYEQVVMVASLFSKRAGRDDLYYRWLSREPYASSRVRFNTMADDAGADLLTLPTTFKSICAVIEVDRQRAVAAAELRDLEAEMVTEMRTRRAENDLYIARFVRALRYRYDSYGYALDHFLVETPHTEAVRVDERLSAMAIWIDHAERGEFCIDVADGWNDRAIAVPGRVLMDAPSEGEYRK